MRFRVLLLCLAGCDTVFSVDHVEPPPPCPEAVEHDEDTDGIDDACDPCPFSSDNDGDDDDDGLALACDPDPLAKNDVLQFTGFEPGTRGHFATIDGAFGPDAFVVAGVGSQYMAWTVPLTDEGVWIIAGVDVARLESTVFREIGLVLDATTAPNSSTQYNGTHCVLGRTTTDYLELYARNRPAADVMLTANRNTPVVIEGFSGIIRGSYSRRANPTTSCSFASGGSEATLGGTQSPLPAAGTLALYATSVEASFNFVLIASKP